MWMVPQPLDFWVHIWSIFMQQKNTNLTHWSPAIPSVWGKDRRRVSFSSFVFKSRLLLNRHCFPNDCRVKRADKVINRGNCAHNKGINGKQGRHLSLGIIAVSSLEKTDGILKYLFVCLNKQQCMVGYGRGCIG